MDGPDDEATRKAALRRATRLARADLGAASRRDASAAAAERLLALPELRRVRTILTYAASGHELDVGAVADALAERRVTVRYPRVAGDELEVVTVTGSDQLREGFRGLREPRGRDVGGDDLDAVIVPGLAFDPTGGRLGQGGGHYDRLLARLPAEVLRIAIGFACQVVPRVPQASHDEPVDIVVTERATYRTGARTVEEHA